MPNETMETEALRKRDFDAYAALLEKHAFPEKTFDSFAAFRRYVCEIDMHVLLGLPAENFFCLFHPSPVPTANIFLHRDGVWMYKCFSTYCTAHAGMDVFGVLKKLTSLSAGDLQIKMAAVLHCTVPDCTSVDIAMTENLELLENWSEECPALKKALTRPSWEVLHCLYAVTSDKLSGYTFPGRKAYTLSESNRHLQNLLGKYAKISAELAKLSFLHLIRRIPLYDIAPTRLKVLPCINHRYINQISLPVLTDEHKQDVFAQAEEWVKRHYTAAGFTARNLLADGLVFEANSYFPQI